MSPSLSRRRFLCISACALASPSVAGASGASWRGIALGAGASMRLEGIGRAEAEPIFAAVEAEVRRLEGIFSLYRTDSALVMLNENGILPNPPMEMLEVLSLAGRIHAATNGAFDPSVQPLWAYHAATAAAAAPPDNAARARARDLTGWHKVKFGARKVSFAEAGMALTLNGIAQGYITDRITHLLRQRGLQNVLVDMGEIAATGRRAEGGQWTAGVALPDETLVHRVTLTDRALATSSSMGTVLEPSAQLGHILDPREANRKAARRLVSVSARTAAIADGLSTGCTLLTEEEIHSALSRFSGARLEAMI